ncbi:hypothetical protein ACFLXC_02710 [Chloroflexota bacterium]
MKSSSRALIGFGAGILVLIIIAVVLVLTLGQATAPLLPDNTPQGTVQRFMQVIQEKNYVQAYEYLIIPTTIDGKPIPTQTFDMWVRSTEWAANSTWKASLGKTTVTGTNNASVEIMVEVFRSSGPFENPVRSNTVTFFLQKHNDKWLITSPTDLYWVY